MSARHQPVPSLWRAPRGSFIPRSLGALLLLAGTAGAQESEPAAPVETITLPADPAPPVTVEEQAEVSSGLDEIVVTAQKRAERVLDVPISIQAFTAESLSARGIDDSSGLQRATPGLSVDEQAQFTTIFLRGVGSDAFLMADPSVAYYVDGIYFPFAQGQSQDFGGVERVEVLKGPQGTLFGRNAVGGAISVVTRDPSLDAAESEFSAGYGSRNTWQGRLYQSLPLGEHLALSAGGYLEEGDHYMRGRANGEPLPQEGDRGLRVKVRWAPLDALDVVLAGQRNEQRGTGSTFTLNNAPTRLFTCDRPLPLPNCIQAQTGYKGALSEASSLRFDNTVYYGQATAELPVFDVKLLGSRQQAESRFTYDFDGSPQALAAFDQKRNFADIRTAELQILSNDQTWGASRVSWIVGGYYFDSAQGFDTANLQLLGLDLGDTREGGFSLPQPLLDVFDQLNLAFPNGDVAFHAIIGTRSKAAFVQTTVQVTDWAALTLGGRYQDEERFLLRSDSGLFQSDGSFVTLFDWNQIGARDADGNFKPTRDTTTSFKPKATLELRPFAGPTLLYLTYQEALKSATYNAVAVYQPPAFVKPEQLEAWELGIKTPLFGGRTTLSAAAFDYDIRDFQVQFISLFQGGAVSFENADAASIRGVDVDVQTQVWPSRIDDLVLTIGAAYLDSRYDRYTSASGFDPEDGSFSSDNDYSGNRIVRTPRWTAAASLSKTWEVPGGEFDASVDGYCNDGFFYASSNARNLDQDRYRVFGLSLQYRHLRSGLGLAVFGRNLGDQKYSQGLIATDFGGNVTLAEPRTWGLRLEWKI